MLFAKILFFNIIIIFYIKNDGIFGVGANENDDLFDEIWQKAFSTKSQNLGKRKATQSDGKEAKARKVKEEQQQPDNEVQLGKIKIEPLVKQEDKMPQTNFQKKVPKTEAQFCDDNFENPMNKLHIPVECDQQQQNNICKKTKYKKKKLIIIDDETKLEIMKNFDNLRKEYNTKNEHKATKNDRIKNEYKIAKDLGTNRAKIYKWKNELKEKSGENDRKKLEIIKKFDQKRTEYNKKMENKKDGTDNEYKIANELGTNRKKIYKWKKEFAQNIEENEGEKLKIIQKFDKMRKEFKLKKKEFYNTRQKRLKKECEIAVKLGTNRHKIFKWKRQLASTNQFSKQQKSELNCLF